MGDVAVAIALPAAGCPSPVLNSASARPFLRSLFHETKDLLLAAVSGTPRGPDLPRSGSPEWLGLPLFPRKCLVPYRPPQQGGPTC